MRVTTRTLGPRRPPTSGIGEPVEVLRDVPRAALVAPSPHVADAVARACAEDDPGVRIVLGVRGTSPDALAPAVETEASRVVAACDRRAALALRDSGFRVIPLACPDRRLAARGVPTRAEADRALTSLRSGADPLAGPDAWAAAEALAAGLARAGLGVAAEAPPAALADPVVLDALERWARARDAGGEVGGDPDHPLTALALAAVLRVARVERGMRRPLAPGAARRARQIVAADDDHVPLTPTGGEPGLLVALGDALDELTLWLEPDAPSPPLADGLALAPVTVVDFSTFLADGGYAEPRWWTAGPPPGGVREPLDWAAQRRFPGRPVVGVCWYEAAAYAAWRSASDGEPVAPATRAQRLAACAAPYPWGAREPDPSVANFAQHVGHVSSARAYPAGRGPRGHRDLSGNVWEWTSEREDDAALVVSGGWFSEADCLTSEYAFPFHRGNRFDDLGFRLGAA